MQKNNYYIFTGGPGAGKTSVLRALAQRGFITVEEVARDIIQDQNKIGGHATHTGDQVAFCELMLQANIANFHQYMDSTQPIFFDRGVPGLVGYCNMTTGVVTDTVQSASEEYRYNPSIFIFPPWEDIYANDEERKQDFQEAEDTYDHLKSAHESCGYQVIEVPKVSVEERVSFILDQAHIKSSKNQNDS